MNVLVTGSTRGIGEQIREQLQRAGACVLSHGTSGGDVRADLLERGAAEDLWKRAVELLDGRIDVLINNAGIYEPVSIDDSTERWHERWHRTMQINLQAAADLCRLAVSHFRSSSGGRIVNVASRAAHRGDSPDHWHYAASKAALIAVTKTIARAYAAENIYAFAVAPGFTMTGMAEEYLTSRGGENILAEIPLHRVNTPEEVANVVAYLALQAPAGMTGAVLDINGASYVR